MMEMSENTKFQNTAGSGILIAKSGISNHAASNILDDLCFSKFGTLPVECSKRGKTQNSMSDAARKKYSDFTPKNAAAGCIWNLSFSLSPYKTYAVLCFRNPVVIFGRGYMPDKLVKHAATVYNRGN